MKKQERSVTRAALIKQLKDYEEKKLRGNHEK